MALISMRQLLDYAAEQQFAIPAFNVSNMEQVQAIMQAADAVEIERSRSVCTGDYLSTILFPDPGLGRFTFLCR